MKYGVIFPQTEIGADPAAMCDYAQAAESLGFHDRGRHLARLEGRGQHFLAAGGGDRAALHEVDEFGNVRRCELRLVQLRIGADLVQQRRHVADQPVCDRSRSLRLGVSCGLLEGVGASP